MSLETDVVVQVLLRQRPHIIAAAVAIIRDVHAADDVFQQVVLAALDERYAIRDTDHLFAWAMRTTRHRAIDLARRRKLIELPDDVLQLLELREDEQDGFVGEQLGALHKCTSKLASHSRELIRMRYQEGLSVPVIAEKMSRSVDAVYQSFSRLHRALRNCVESELSHGCHEEKLHQ